MSNVHWHPIDAISRNLETGAWICAHCDVELVSSPDEDPAKMGMGIRFIGATEDRLCIVPLRRRLWAPIHNAWWTFLILLTQSPRVFFNRTMWWIFDGMYSSGCANCQGTGHLQVIVAQTGKSTRMTCSHCNGFHD